MPTRLVILAAEVLTPGQNGKPAGSGSLDAVARLGHAGYAVAVILQANPVAAGANEPLPLRALAAASDGQVAAFFQRAAHTGGLEAALAEAVRRWRTQLDQVHCVATDPTDLATIVRCGGRAATLATHLDPATELPAGCRLHADLAAFVDTLLEPEAPA